MGGRQARGPRLTTIAVISLLSTCVSLKPTIATEFTDLGDLELYKISWKGPYTQMESLDEDNVIDIQTKAKERYKCIVPDESDQVFFDTSAKNSSIPGDEDQDENKDPFYHLEPLMKDNYCSYKFELYWIYELCHGKFLRQYHEEAVNSKAKVTQEFFLGKTDPELLRVQLKDLEKNQSDQPEKDGQMRDDSDNNGRSDERPTVVVNGQSKPYVMFKMTGGTKCDLTKKNRAARVLYVCNEEAKNELYSIKETSTCEYEVIVLTPLLCQHKDFKIDSNTQHEIKCYSMNGSPRRPLNSLDDKELQTPEEDISKNPKRRAIASIQGRTLIIDADLLWS